MVWLPWLNRTSALITELHVAGTLGNSFKCYRRTGKRVLYWNEFLKLTPSLRIYKNTDVRKKVNQTRKNLSGIYNKVYSFDLANKIDSPRQYFRVRCPQSGVINHVIWQHPRETAYNTSVDDKRTLVPCWQIWRVGLLSYVHK